MEIKQLQLQLKVVWLKDFLGLAIDNVILDQSYSLTPYYFWPKTEALEQLKLELDSKLWLTQEEKVRILTIAGEVINYWFSNRDLKPVKKNFTAVFPEVKIPIFNN
jgi:30S ribosomal protein 3